MNDPTSQIGPSEKTKLLIVDDVPHNIQIIASILNKKGFEISFASNGLHAIEIAERIIPDMILLDIMMPELDGFETCKRIKNIPHLADIPIIFLTARSQPEDIISGFKHGAVDYVSKPFNNSELVQRVFTHLELKKSKEKLTEYVKVIDKQKEKLEEKNNELEELIQLKDRIFSIVAHDLKNPFNSLIGFTEILIEDLSIYDKDQIKNISYLINDTANKGYLLLQNFMEWTMLQSKKIKHSPIKLDIANIVEIALVHHKSMALNKKIKIDNLIEEDTFAYADEFMIASVIRNLLSNALKFTDENGIITIRTKKADDMLIIQVQDTGIGIDIEFQKTIFKSNTASSLAGTNGEKGTGLGMGLCKGFVETNGGDIWIKSKKGEGSTFSFSIPKHNEINENTHQQ